MCCKNGCAGELGLLFQTLRHRGAAALTQWTAHNREHIVPLLPSGAGKNARKPTVRGGGV